MSHISRMCSPMSWGIPSAGRGMLGLFEGGPQALQLAAAAGSVDPLLDFAHRIEILVELALIARADCAAEIAGIGEHRVEHALVAALWPRRGKAGRRPAPGRARAAWASSARSTRCASCRASSSSCAPTDSTSRRREPGWAPWSSCPCVLRQQLVEARAGADVAAGGQRCAREEVAGLRAVDVALQGLGVVQAADEEHLFAKVGQRREHLAELHARAAAARPPLAAVETVAGEEHRQPHGRVGRAGGDGRGAGSSPQTRSDSIQGSAMVTPAPRRNVRREKLVWFIDRCLALGKDVSQVGHTAF